MSHPWKIAIALSLFASSTLAAEKLQLVQPDRLANYWLLAATGDASVPNSGRNLQAPSCAAVAYAINKNGTTSQVKLERLVPDGDLGKVAISTVSGLRFAAAPQNRGKDAVYTYMVIPFNLPDANSPKAADRALRTRALAACKLENFRLPIP